MTTYIESFVMALILVLAQATGLINGRLHIDASDGLVIANEIDCRTFLVYPPSPDSVCYGWYVHFGTRGMPR